MAPKSEYEKHLDQFSNCNIPQVLRPYIRSPKGRSIVIIYLSRLHPSFASLDATDPKNENLYLVAESTYEILAPIVLELKNILITHRMGVMIYTFKGYNAVKHEEIFTEVESNLVNIGAWDPEYGRIIDTPVVEVYDLDKQEISCKEELDRLSLLSNLENEKNAKLRNMEARQQTLRPLDSTQIDKIENFISGTDLTGFIKKQALCIIRKEGNAEPIFTELFVSIREMTDAMITDIDLVANRWLFQHLTQALDFAIQKQLATDYNLQDLRSISVNLNLISICNPTIQRLLLELVEGPPKRVIMLEVQLLDVVANQAMFIKAKAFAKSSGMLICIEGLMLDQLSYLNPEFFGCDFYKIGASQNFGIDTSEEDLIFFHNKISAIGRRKVVLTRCDNEQMLQIAQNLGIRLFQGYYIDIVLEAQKGSKRRTRMV